MLVSVLVPVRNAAATLGVALRSVLRSRGVELEVVVVDHASTDGTRAILERFPSIRVLEAPATDDLAAVLERGRRACVAPTIARMDGDDVMHPDRLAADVAHLERTSVSAVASRVKLIPRGRTTPGLRAYVAWQNAVLTAEEHAREIWVEQPLCHPATTFRASALDDVGGFRAGPWPEDYELYLRLITAGHAIEKRPEVHHAWRQHAGTAVRHARDVFATEKAKAMVKLFRIDERPVLVAGAGKEGGRIGRALLAQGVRIAAFLDVNPARIGRTRFGVPVHDAKELKALRTDDVFLVAAVGTSGARGVVRAAIEDAGFVEGKDAVVVA